MGSLAQADITGYSMVMANGQIATVIKYNNSKDMTIQFEDGTIKEHVYKVHYLKGKVANPSIGDKQKGAAYVLRNKSSVEGVTVMQNCGQLATCIQYRGSKDIDVEFEDGTIVHSVYKYSFINGHIKNPNAVIGSMLGEFEVMNCGMIAQVIRDESSTDIDVQFEDGTVVKHRSRTDFRAGEIACPSLSKYYANRKYHIGDTRMMNCGMEAEIISYRRYDDIDVLFEDGTIVENRSTADFRRGSINNPNYYKYDIIGEELMMNCGMICKVIRQDRSVTDLDVEFEDGTVVEHKTKKEFYNRSIQNPNIPRFNSMPQALLYYIIRKHFSDTVSDYRPDWLTNEKTGNKLELDIWIPSMDIGIEYDGYIERHTKCTWQGMMKLEAINSASQIKKLIVVNERGTYIYTGSKIEHYKLNNVSHRSQYKNLIIEICNVAEDIVAELGGVSVGITPYDIDAYFDNFEYARFLNGLRALFSADGIEY